MLDVAAGTAVSTVELAAGGVRAIACDFSQGMLRAGAARPVPKVAGDAMALPLADESVDGVVISFGLRNVADPDAALREFRRVTRPGGTLVVCEFSSPTWAPFRTVYTEYLMKALPRIARAVSSNPEAYVYLAESIRAWPDQPALAGAAAGRPAGPTSPGSNLTGGIVALHRARRPAESTQRRRGLHDPRRTAMDRRVRRADTSPFRTRDRIEATGLPRAGVDRLDGGRSPGPRPAASPAPGSRSTRPPGSRRRPARRRSRSRRGAGCPVR